MMYFSGVNSSSLAAHLLTAGVSHVLVDPKDHRHVAGRFPSIALDSGAYRAFKSGVSLNIPAYLDFADRHGPFAFIVAPDVIGDFEASLRNWRRWQRPGMVPVWGWGAPTDHLKRYLDEAPIVGLGGLACLMREKDKPTLRELTKVVNGNPGRFHAFGLNWPKAIGDLDALLSSHDSSTWLKAARYGYLFFVNTRTGKPQAAPWRIVAQGRNFEERAERLVESARVLHEWCNDIPGVGPRCSIKRHTGAAPASPTQCAAQECHPGHSANGSKRKG